MIKVSLNRNPRSHNETGRPWYDTKDGVARGILSLANFNELIHARHEAAYEKNESLNEFIVLGHYQLDSAGNCGVIEWQESGDMFSQIPNVLTAPEFYDYFRNKKSNLGFSVNLEGLNLIPPARVKCAYCDKFWNIKNCHDVITWTSGETVSLADFVGQELSHFKGAYQAKTDGVYHFGPSIISIRNDKNIDLSLKYPNSRKLWEKDVVKNEYGYLDEEIGDDYVISDGDECSFTISKFFHSKCNRLNISENYEKYYRNIFTELGFTVSEMKSSPNELCGCERCAPWFLVTTDLGVFKIGCHKQVINIDWSLIADSNIISLFENEDAIKTENSIHAWGKEKAQEYMNKIYKHLKQGGQNV